MKPHLITHIQQSSPVSGDYPVAIAMIVGNALIIGVCSLVAFGLIELL
ncbi:hypothetical protein [Hufsiella ginkgonis]|uniref:Uncharacterized protein n=1 Tax=Hufsiella ginkgonis TaxID=2695274 RepID=A0A7K1Y3H0_9SPHI|nr:hypothetical protein [Hufsiella ginkgonis]MXV17226.1 hypothetical protein [Hufsiella ginkgonis]